MDKINLTANLKSGVNPQITLLEGAAPNPINPTGYDKSGGDLQSVLDFYMIRKGQGVLEDKTSLLTVSANNVSLTLESDLGLPTHKQISGNLAINPYLLGLGFFGVDKFNFKTYSQKELKNLSNTSKHLIGDKAAVLLKRISQMKTRGDYQRENKNNDKGKVLSNFSADVQLLDDQNGNPQPFIPETISFTCQLFSQSVIIKKDEQELDYDNFTITANIMLSPADNGGVGIWFDAQDAFENIKKAKEIVLNHYVSQFDEELPRFNIA